jgi:hypothetical protein
LTGGPISDTNGNCTVDVGDYTRLALCLMGGGPNVQLGRTCTQFYDYNGDGDNDLEDVAGFQSAFGR